MVYFPDLTPYEYFRDESTALNVGWLSPSHPFPQGDVPAGFVERLRRLKNHPVNQTRGFHLCPWCDDGFFDSSVDRRIRIQRMRDLGACSSAEIRALGMDGRVYAAPMMICHYVEAHRYKPPQEFIDAVMQMECEIEPPTD